MKLPGREFVVEGIRQGYQFIINSVSKSMAEGSLPNLARESNRLAQEAWVLVQGCKFVRPCELCFDLEKDTPQGIPCSVALQYIYVSVIGACCSTYCFTSACKRPVIKLLLLKVWTKHSMERLDMSLQSLLMAFLTWNKQMRSHDCSITT